MDYIQRLNVGSGKALSERAKYMILRVFTEEEGKPRGSAWSSTARILGVAKGTIANVLREFEENGCILGDNASGGNASNHERIIESPTVTRALMDFVRERQRRAETTYIKHIMDECLRPFGIICSDRTVARALQSLDLTCNVDANVSGNDWSNALHVEEPFYTRLDRWNYLSRIADARIQKRFIVWTDESFVYQGPTRRALGWFDPHCPLPKFNRGRRLNLVGAIADDGRPIKEAMVAFERWELVDGERGEGKVRLSTSGEPKGAASVEEHDDFNEMLKEWTAKHARRHVALDDFRRAHIEYCVDPKVFIVPLTYDEMIIQLSEHDLTVEEDTVKGIELSKQPTLTKLELDPEAEHELWISQDDGVVCALCELPVAVKERNVTLAVCGECTGGDALGRVGGPRAPRHIDALRGDGNVPLVESDDVESDSDEDGGGGDGSVPKTKKRKKGGGGAKEFDKYLDHEFVHWWFQYCVLPGLEKANISNALIVFDLASSHLDIGEGESNLSTAIQSKKNAMSWLSKHGIPFDERESAAQLKDLVRATFTGQTRLQQLALAAGHDVVYLPAHHPRLNPIENVWAWTKGTLAREYRRGRTFVELAQRARELLCELDTEMVRRMCERSRRCEHEFIQLETQVLHERDLEAKMEYRTLLDKHEEVGDPGGGDGAPPARPTSAPETMPFRFRGDLNRFFKNQV